MFKYIKPLRQYQVGGVTVKTDRSEKKRNVLWKQDDFVHGVPKFQAISSTSHENGRQCHFHVDMIKMFMTKINNQ